MSAQSAAETIRDLYQKYAEGIYRYSRALVPRHLDPQDVVQEVFLRAHKALPEFQYRSLEKTWLYAIARNYIHDLMRRHRLEQTYMSRHDVEELLTVETPGQDLEFTELFHELSQAYRNVIRLRSLEGMSVRETAEALGWTEESVRVTYFRAKRKLRQVIGREWKADGLRTDFTATDSIR